jgi:hypothetical protein
MQVAGSNNTHLSLRNMKILQGHLSYCTNIHAGESWSEHFESLQKHVPVIKQRISGDNSFGIGLRLSNIASIELAKEENLQRFKEWLSENDCYVFTMNGFPYGSFHQTKVKDHVHTPDWTTNNRVDYTIRLAQILCALLPDGLEGGISTSPLSYKHWHTNANKRSIAFEEATLNVLRVTEELIKLKKVSGRHVHIDIEPEPDGLLESGTEFIDWYKQHLLRLGIPFIVQRFDCNKKQAETWIKDHIQLCYDVCHFAVGYEDHTAVIKTLKHEGIKTGKIQISAVAEWRAHFHVPVFINDFGALQSTQQDIEQVLAIHKSQPFTNHLEVETYTWEVLPETLKLPIGESVIRELGWVMELLKQND